MFIIKEYAKSTLRYKNTFNFNIFKKYEEMYLFVRNSLDFIHDYFDYSLPLFSDLIVPRIRLHKNFTPFNVEDSNKDEGLMNQLG